jgi:hypothetical protein
MNIEQFFDEAKHKFHVDDICTEYSKIIFILESPHKEELKHGVPLAGLSGRSMAKELFQVSNIEPMGKYLSSQFQSVYAIVNVSPFPLQKSAYPKDFVQRFVQELEIAESIRTSTAKSFREENKALFHSLLVKDFKARLMEHIGGDSIIVPCGKFAERFVNELVIKNENLVIDGVPHPSYNSWARPRYKEVIDRVRKEGKQKTS